MPGNMPAKYAQLNELRFTDDARAVLVHIIKTAFPHANVPDGPYERMADRIIAAADEETWFRLKLLQGVETLNSMADGTFADLDPEAATEALKGVEHMDFFAFIRRQTVLEMYDDEEIWSAVGYEGPSFDKGGYIDRGFNDLDWLPDPRITECEDPLPDIADTADSTDANNGKDA